MKTFSICCRFRHSIGTPKVSDVLSTKAFASSNGLISGRREKDSKETPDGGPAAGD
tara:strand:- start:40 stop:207 length:168 start_codon:yes stop_codon:yes gene_type:complete